MSSEKAQHTIDLENRILFLESAFLKYSWHMIHCGGRPGNNPCICGRQEIVDSIRSPAGRPTPPPAT